MKAVKGNKEYTIDESQQKFYEDSGFDIKDDNGHVVAYGRGKSVPYGEYMAVKKELEAARETADKKNGEDVIRILAAYAHEHGVDLGKAASVEGIVKKIKEHNPEGGA